MPKLPARGPRGANYNPGSIGTNPINAIGGAIKNTVKGAGEELGYLGGKAKDWVGKGMPLPGATKAAPGKTYLRGQQVPMPDINAKKAGMAAKMASPKPFSGRYR